MGLCKCSKRKVTNQFCFKHRVNVCEYCLVNDHQKCVVQSYMQWLQDNDWDPRCQLCKTSLDLQPCVRLVCYHLFHWSCLNEYASSLPPSTAPAGYKCPSCQHALLPPAHLVSAVGDALRQQLQHADWARAALASSGEPSRTEVPDKGNSDGSVLNHNSLAPTDTCIINSSDIASANAADIHRNAHTSRHQHISETECADSRVIDIGGTFHRDLSSIGEARKFVEECHPLSSLLDSDSTENKYRRRSPTEWLQRWTRRFIIPAVRYRAWPVHRRFLLVALLAVVALVSLVRWFAGQSAAEFGDVDPAFDPRFNPNVHVQE